MDLSGRPAGAAAPRAPGSVQPLPEDAWRLMIERAPLGVAVLDLKGRFLQVNPAMARLVGVPREQLLTMAVNDLGHPDDPPLDPAAFTAMLREDDASAQLERRHLRPDGRVVWLALSVTVVHDADRRPTCLVGQAMDVTEVHDAREQLRLSRLRAEEAESDLRAAVNAAPQGFAVYQGLIDPAGALLEARLLFTNRVGAAAGDVDAPAPLPGMELREFFPPAVQVGLWDAIAGALGTGRTFDLRMEYDGPLGHRVVDGSVAPLRDNRVISTWVDVTEQVSGERLLAAAYEETAQVRATLETALDASPDGFAVHDAVRDAEADGQVVRLPLVAMNATGADSIGLGVDELLGRDLVEYLPQAAGAGLWESCVEALTDGRPVSRRIEHVVDGRWLGAWDFRLAPVGQDRLVVIWREVSEEVLAQRRLEEAEALARAAVDASLDGLAVFEFGDEEPPELRLRQLNAVAAAAAPRLLQAVGLQVGQFLPRAMAGPLAELMTSAHAQGRPRVARVDVPEEIAPAGIYEFTATPVGAARLLLLWRDVTAEVLAERRIVEARDEAQHAATHDPLTGLPNRALLRERLSAALDRCGPAGRVAAVFVDLDHFKEVNDTYGHAAGDVLLKAVAVRLREAVRDGDTVSRLAGDEFVMVLSELPERWDPHAFFARFYAILGQPVEVEDGVAVVPEASLGLALAPPAPATVDDLLERADAAMYESKRTGRSRGHVYGEGDGAG